MKKLKSLAAAYRKELNELFRLHQALEGANERSEFLRSRSRPGASEEAILAAEKARGMKFPESYRTFLRTFDGWDRFDFGQSFLGTKELTGTDYEGHLENLHNADPLPKNISEALIIGWNENDAQLLLLLKSGQVVSWLYEEVGRSKDLLSFIKETKQDFKNWRQAVAQRKARTKKEWTQTYRQNQDRLLETELQKVLKKSSSSPVANVEWSTISPASNQEPTPAAAELVVRQEGKTVADVGLGLILYLAATPTRKEVLQTYRFFRRHFPIKGTFEWIPASPNEFLTTKGPDPDSEPFGEALKIDDQGYYGLRVEIHPENSQPSSYINIRGIPPDDNRREQASFVEVFVPGSENHTALEALCCDLAALLPVLSGKGGWYASVRNERSRPNPWDTVFSWCRRFWGIEAGYVDGWLIPAMHRHCGPNWLTVLGRPFVKALEAQEKLSFSSSIARHDLNGKMVLRAGATPPLADAAFGEFPEAIAEVARTIEPVMVAKYERHGMLSMAGLFWTTFTEELPGAFEKHRATLPYLRRFSDPAGFLLPTAREQGEALLEALCQENGRSDLQDWKNECAKEEDSFRELLRLLYNASTGSKPGPLLFEALEFAARYPDEAIPQVFNNLLFNYLNTNQTEKGLAIMRTALATAKKNPHTYHNAACIYMRAGQPDKAMKCVELAKKYKYAHMDKLKNDTELVPLQKLPRFQAVFKKDSSHHDEL